jgi:hypothetical protein
LKYRRDKERYNQDIFRAVYIFATILIILLKYFATKLNEYHDNEAVAQ